MEKYIESKKIIGATKEIMKRIEYILDSEGLLTEVTTIGNYPENRTFTVTPRGKEVIILAQAIIDMFKKFYQE